tara:strand:+ start:1169 stop:1606 length:438 start_codon:yes stop_codon:yes gene_type:complete
MNNMQHYSTLISIAESDSDDLQTQVGCVITDDVGRVLVTSANKFTAGVTATVDNTARPEKYDWIEHAERNAIYSAAKKGVSLLDATMYLAVFPCVECARAIAQTGISKLYTGSIAGWDEERYKFNKSRTILASAGVELIEGWRPE